MSIPFHSDISCVVGSGTRYIGVGSSAGMYTNAGNPEGAVAALIGSICQDTTNGSVFVKTSGTGNTGWTILAAGSGTTDLGIGAITGTTLQVTSSSGTNATVPAATATDAGLLIAADKVKLNHVTVTQAVNLDAMELDISQHQTLFGVADGSVDLGTFTGAVIADDETVKGALQDLETAVESRLTTSLTSARILVGSSTNIATSRSMAGDVTLSNTGVATVVTATTTSAGKVELATDAETLAGSLTTRATSPANVDHYFTTLVGNATGVQHLGAFSGTTISDNRTVKAALQDLETFVESLASGLTFAGTWNATTVDPTAGLANNSFLRVSVAGTTSITTTNMGAKNDWAVGDFILKDNLGNIHVIDNTDAPINLATGTITNTTVQVTNSSGGANVTLPAAAASTSATAGDGDAGMLSGDDKYKLNALGGYAETYGGATSNVITHGLGTLDVLVQVFRVADGVQIFPSITRNSVNAVTLVHSIAPTASSMRVLISKIGA